ncbi:MAG: hypothetical protein A2Y33_12750 [Spirochaetes bacterium GWF1_51_8]|nr:MAG: hypothetical protein A2Y33_12750 [Spirochaetes bacterium GWF1_51_8]
MKGKMIVIRIAFIWGIVADAVMTVLLSFPGLFIVSNNLNAAADPGFTFALLNSAPLMLGWTLVLIWGAIKPIERIGILLCLIPLLIYYMAVNIIGLTLGVCRLENTILLLVLQASLLVFMVLGYVFGRQIRKTETGNAV